MCEIFIELLADQQKMLNHKDLCYKSKYNLFTIKNWC